MTHEEMERMMQFILEQQAQFAINQQQAEERMTKLEGSMKEMGENVAALAVAQTRTSNEVARMSEEMARLAQSEERMNAAFAAMMETHQRTEERLGAFISVLERYISEDRHGKGRGGDAA